MAISFEKGKKYTVVTTNSHMVVSQNKHGLYALAEPTTRNSVVGRVELDDGLEYIGRLDGRPTFKLPKPIQDGGVTIDLIAGHVNNFDIGTEYNQDKIRNRGLANASNTKPEDVRKAVASLFGTLVVRDARMAASLADEMSAQASRALGDLVMAEMLAAEEQAPQDSGEPSGQDAMDEAGETSGVEYEDDCDAQPKDEVEVEDSGEVIDEDAELERMIAAEAETMDGEDSGEESEDAEDELDGDYL